MIKIFKQKIIKKLTRHFQHLYPYLRRYRRWAILTVVFVLAKEGATLLEPAVYKQIVVIFQDYFGGKSSYDAVVHQGIWLVIAFIGIQVGVLVSHLIMFHSVNRLESAVMRDAANDFMSKVLQLSFGFHSDRRTGRLAKQYARGINAIEVFFDSFLFSLIPLVIRLSVILVIYFWIDVIIGLVLALLAVVFCVFSIYASLAMARRRKVANVLDDEGSRKAIDALMNAEAVKYFNQEEFEIAAHETLRQTWKEQKQSEWDGWNLISAGQIFINISAVTLILAASVWRLSSGSLGLPNFVLVISYLTFMFSALWEFQHHVRRLQEALTDLTAFFGYFAMMNEVRDAPHARLITVTRGEVVFDKVTFAYQNSGHDSQLDALEAPHTAEKSETPVMQNLSFTVPAGRSVALVGPSGVGKSTIIKLLYRFYDPLVGRVLIDGQDITQVTQQSLRAALAIVPQETALFNDTIAYNIAYGAGDVSREQIQAAARFAHANAFIEKLPKQYNTLVGERGVKLSGGERQRLAIARAFLRNAPILVLDEATSSLDSAVEVEIQESLKELMRGRTTLIIAHRLSTVMNADIIVVINNGRVEQQGSHAELLQKGGLYHRLWELQAGGYIAAA